MIFKGADGNSYNVASNEKANTGVALGAIGTGLGVLNGIGNMFGLSRNNGWNNCGWNCNGGYGGMYNYHPGYANGACEPGARYVTKGETDLMQQLQDKDIIIARKDSEIALKESESYTDKKLVEVTTYLDGKVNRLADKVDNNLHEQMLINAKQGEWNAAATGSMQSMATQIASLQSITEMFVPGRKVCNQSCCGCGCGANA